MFMHFHLNENTKKEIETSRTSLFLSKILVLHQEIIVSGLYRLETFQLLLFRFFFPPDSLPNDNIIIRRIFQDHETVGKDFKQFNYYF